MDTELDPFFTITDVDGTEVECEILVTFALEETGKTYIIYTDNTEDEEGALNVFAASVDGDKLFSDSDESIVLNEIESDEEWELIEEVLADLEGEECDCDDPDCDHNH
ncbi:MAG: DUF1292 domain-containing protein [Coriobacteriales bacterium]|nr:DUF1292 domain-containing protein [Coriobacteriales bacterium]